MPALSGRATVHQPLALRPARKRLPQWAIPLAYSIAALLLGVLLPRIETQFLPALSAQLSVASAMSIDSAIASGMIALTGIVFSLAFVMVQFGATAYSPRLVLWISSDPLLMHAIGVFTATFLYAVAALAWIDRSGSGKVPALSAWAVVVLLLASVCMFAGLIHRIGRLQIQSVLVFSAARAREEIEALFPPLDSTPPAPPTPSFETLQAPQTLLHHGPPRTIQALDEAALVAAARASGAVIEMVSAIGDTVGEGVPLLRVYGAAKAIPETMLRQAIVTGGARTFEQDPKYAIYLLTDIGMRALSPAVNDPSTAVQALDQIQDLLLRLGRRRLDVGALRDTDGQLRLVVPVPDWEDFLDLALEQIRRYGASDLEVVRRIRALLVDLLAALPAERRPALRQHLERLEATIARHFEEEDDVRLASIADRQGLGAGRRRRPHA
jgi:uncharacterized membrane protein